MDPAPLNTQDRALLRRFRAGDIAASPENAGALTRVVWVHTRLWGPVAAGAQLTRAAQAWSSADEIDAVVGAISAADAADTLPACCSSEFAWRHPELVDWLARRLPWRAEWRDARD